MANNLRGVEKYKITITFPSAINADMYIRRSCEIAGVYAIFEREKAAVSVYCREGTGAQEFKKAFFNTLPEGILDPGIQERVKSIFNAFIKIPACITSYQELGTFGYRVSRLLNIYYL